MARYPYYNYMVGILYPQNSSAGRLGCCVALLLLMGLGCAARQAPRPEEAPPFPEVLSIAFTGNTAFSSATLRQTMATKQRPVFPPWARGEAYNPPTLEADVLRLKKWYFDRGFLDCTVRLERVQEDAQHLTVRLTLAIEEGQPTRVAAVHLDGPVPPELPPAIALLAMLPLQPEQVLTKEHFEHSKTFLLTHLHNAAYARAQVTPQTIVDREQRTATVTFTLRPGAPTVFGHTTFQGARYVAEQAIRRQLTMRPGEPATDQTIATSAEAIYGLGMFQAVTPHALNPEAPDEPLDVAFDLIERKPRSLQFGLGYSTTAGFRTEVQWAHRNLNARAQQLTLSGTVSSIEQKSELRFHLPYFLAARTSLTQTLFVRNEQEIDTNPVGGLFGAQREAQPAFDLLSLGAETRLTHRLSDMLSGVVGINVSRNDFRHVNRAALTPIEQEIAADNTLVGQFVELQWNTSTSFLNPTHGFLVRGRIDQAHTRLLSDVSFLKWLVEARHYQPLWRQLLLATRLEVGGIRPYNARGEVPFNVRFFAGGAGSVRGFALNRLGPLNASREPIGGKSLFEGSTELRFPLFGDFGAAIFVDFGNVFRSVFTYHLGDLRYAVGPGLRYNTPVGPVRLDVGFLLDRRPGEDFGRVEFSIGQAF